MCSNVYTGYSGAEMRLVRGRTYIFGAGIIQGVSFDKGKGLLMMKTVTGDDWDGDLQICITQEDEAGLYTTRTLRNVRLDHPPVPFEPVPFTYGPWER